MVNYPKHLIDEEQPNIWLSKLKEKLVLLHKNGILHGDLSEDNVVMNGQDLRIIDYGMSIYLTDLAYEGIYDCENFSQAFKYP